jgi:hypothetical protein
MIYLEPGTYTDVQGAAIKANVSPATIRAWILGKSLKSIKLGGAHIIKLEWLEAAMAIERKPGPKEREGN